MASATSDETAKLVPSAVRVAPSGKGRPGRTFIRQRYPCRPNQTCLVRWPVLCEAYARRSAPGGREEEASACEPCSWVVPAL